MPYYYRAKDKDKKKSTRKKDSTSSLINRLDRIFALYIRLRDAMPSGYFKCISCGRILPFDKGQCGHYWSRRHMATRFSEDNCNCECAQCNVFSADHIALYTPNLIRKIGQSRFDELNWKHQSVKNWSDFELKEMIQFYKDKVLKLSSEKGIYVKV